MRSHDKGMAKKQTINGGHSQAIWVNILYMTAAVVLPGTFLFQLFNVNKLENILLFNHFVILALILGAVSCLFLLLFMKLAAGREGAMVMLFLLWSWFFLFGAVNDFLHRNVAWFRRSYMLIGILLLLAAVLFFFRRHKGAVSKYAVAFRALPFAVIVLFVYNFTPAFHEELVRIAGWESDGRPFDVKTEFTIDHSLPRPDIYWFHMEEGMNFVTGGSFFGDGQEGLLAALEDRGFVVNPDATLNAGDTSRALPAMLSPGFHDSYLGRLLNENEHLSREERLPRFYEAFQRDGISQVDDLARNFELFRAFMKRGYRQVTVSDKPDNYLPLLDMYYATSEHYVERPFHERTGEGNAAALFDLFELLMMTTPMIYIKDQTAILFTADDFIRREIPRYEDEVERLADAAAAMAGGVAPDSHSFHCAARLFRMLTDSFAIPSPKLIYIVNELAHAPYGQISGTGSVNPAPGEPYNVDLLYWPQWRFATATALMMIDMVLAEDPDAVIVLQGDHGIHNLHAHDYMRGAGYSEAEILEMNFSTISALRIPESLGGPDGPVAPLDLTRLLVNRFVGENYAEAAP